MPLDDMPFIKYDLYNNYKKYPLYLEESRGVMEIVNFVFQLFVILLGIRVRIDS